MTSCNCIFCGESAKKGGLPPLEQEYVYECKVCGNFKVTSDIENLTKLDEKQKSILSGYCREFFDSEKVATISSDALENILNSPLVPKTPMEKLDKLLLWHYKKTTYFGELFPIQKPVVCYALNNEELSELYKCASEIFLKKLHDKYDAYPALQRISLTLEGHEYCKELMKNGNINSNTAFVAMWFDEEMKSPYENSIKAAIIECGFEPIKIDNVEHNNDITDEIIVGIKQSKFVIADMTGYRGGVYYEAGYAKGLGKPVIFTCRKDWFEEEKDANGKIVKQAVHFDINHQNIIVWEEEEELKKRIIDRIKATIL